MCTYCFRRLHDDVNKMNLNLFKLHGYFLTNYSIVELADGVKRYNASCEENGHPFKISVTMSVSKIINFGLNPFPFYCFCSSEHCVCHSLCREKK